MTIQRAKRIILRLENALTYHSTGVPGASSIGAITAADCCPRLRDGRWGLRPRLVRKSYRKWVSNEDDEA